MADIDNNHARDMARAWSPASVGNVAVGFDILGHSVAGVGDTVEVRRIDSAEVRIADIRGVTTDLPRNATANTASVALSALRTALELPFGFELTLHKGLTLGSGMGGSGASAVAALTAANALLEQPQHPETLYDFALAGEEVASGSRTGDNVGCMLLGGLVLATPERLVRIPVPDHWYCAVLHPHVMLETSRTRAVLDGSYQLPQFVAQSRNLALLLAGCHQADSDLVRQGLSDELIEPRRAPLLPGFADVKQAALDAGALGAGISGGGPSIFAWFDGHDRAISGGRAMQTAVPGQATNSDVFVSTINAPAAHLVDQMPEPHTR